MAFLIVLLLLLILPIGTFMIYCVSVRSGKAVIDTYETPEGHTLTVTQLGRQEHLGNTFLFLIEVDGEKYLRFPLTASYTEERLYPSENVSCASNSFGEVVLQMGSGSEPCEFRFSSDFQVIHFIRSESYTLLKDGVEVLEYK